MTLHKTPIHNKELTPLSIIKGRVTDIFLDPAEENSIRFSPIYPGNSGIGAIEFEYVTNIINLSKGYAKPLFPQMKYYPVINESVYLIEGPTNTTTENSNNVELYYVNVFNTFNSPHINPQPIIEGGIVNSTELNNDFGKTFRIKNIQSLLPFEGDHIIEGRWGNSLRFGSTISGSITTNEWSLDGVNGNPITILRNGQTLNNNSIDFTLEDINQDSSSLYMTNGQQLPINVASKNLSTFNIILGEPNKILIAVEDVKESDSYNNIDNI